MMRRSLYIAAVLLLCAACRTGDGDNAVRIRFSTPSIETKTLTGQELTGTAYPAGENFKVYAAYSAEEWAQDAAMPASTSLMAAQECAYAGGVSWEPLTVYTWDQLTGAGTDPYLHAQAFSPAALTGVSHSWTDGFSLASYDTPAVGSMVDILFSDRAYNYQKTTKAGHVDLHFRHALTSVVFKIALHTAYTDLTTTHIELTGIRLKNVYTRGNFAQGLSNARNDSAPFQTGYPQWTGQSTEATLTGFMPFGELLPAVYTSDDNWLISHEALLLIPQATDHGGNQVTIEMDYTIQQGDGETIAGTVSAPLTAESHWKGGQRYVYRIYFEPTELSVSLVITPWADPTAILLQ